MQSWLEGRNWVGKCAQSTGMAASLRILSSKADSNTWESFTRSELKLESVHQESPHSDIFRKRATKPLLKQKQWFKVLFSDESMLYLIWWNSPKCFLALLNHIPFSNTHKNLVWFWRKWKVNSPQASKCIMTFTPCPIFLYRFTLYFGWFLFTVTLTITVFI